MNCIFTRTLIYIYPIDIYIQLIYIYISEVVVEIVTGYGIGYQTECGIVFSSKHGYY